METWEQYEDDVDQMRPNAYSHNTTISHRVLKKEVSEYKFGIIITSETDGWKLTGWVDTHCLLIVVVNKHPTKCPLTSTAY